MDVRPLPGHLSCVINKLHVNDSIARERSSIADLQSHNCTQHVVIRQGQCSCRQSGVTLHVIERGCWLAAKHEVVFLCSNANQQHRCLENKLVQIADTRSQYFDLSG